MPLHSPLSTLQLPLATAALATLVVAPARTRVSVFCFTRLSPSLSRFQYISLLSQDIRFETNKKIMQKKSVRTFTEFVCCFIIIIVVVVRLLDLSLF